VSERFFGLLSETYIIYLSNLLTLFQNHVVCAKLDIYVFGPHIELYQQLTHLLYILIFKIFDCICDFNSNTTGVKVYPPLFCGVPAAQSLVFCVVFCRSLFVLLIIGLLVFLWLVFTSLLS
jgi:hypothetical protein